MMTAAAGRILATTALGALLLAPAVACAADRCRPTETSIEGPYYVAGAPFRSDVIPAGGEGERLVLEGTVFSGDCRTALESAVVELWQAGPGGQYDFTDRYLWRGRMKTDARGRYAFQTVLPGRYRAGSTFRPAHIHLRVSHTDGRTLITQVYFANDPHLGTDPFVKESLVIGLDRFKEKGAPRYRGVFNIVLEKP